MLPFQTNAMSILNEWRPIQDAVASWVIHGALFRFPKLKVGIVEAGSKWMFPLLDSMAEVYKKAPEAFPGNPIEEIKNRIYVSPFYEEGIDDLINLIGVDQVLYGSDWPHPEGLAEPTHYVTALEHLSVEDQAKIMGGNLGRLVTHSVTAPDDCQTIPEMVLSAADRFGDAEAVVDGPLRLSFTELVDRIRCAAGAFADLGIEKGDRVAVWAPNSAEWIIAAFGLLTAGGVLVPVNTRFKADEAADIIGRSGAKAVLIQKGFLGQDYAAPAGVPVIDLKSDFLSSGTPFAREVSGTDISDIIYTSGTTGRPKGVMMNHRQNLRLYAEWCELADLREGDRYLMVNPFFHTFGFKAG